MVGISSEKCGARFNHISRSWAQLKSVYFCQTMESVRGFEESLDYIERLPLNESYVFFLLLEFPLLNLLIL